MRSPFPSPRPLSACPTLILALLLSAFAPLLTAAAAETAPEGKLIVSEDFSGPKLPSNFEPGGRPNSFSIAEGALRGIAQPDDTHGPSIGVPISATDLHIQFRMKFAPKGYFLFLVDGESAFGGAAHLLRVALTETQAYVAQDRGSLDSKNAQKLEKDAAAKTGKTVPAPTAEQLADPKYYRTERLASQPGSFEDGQWHTVSISLRGQHFQVQIDDHPAMTGEGTVFAVKKSRLVFLVAHGGTVLVDDVKVWDQPPVVL